MEFRNKKAAYEFFILDSYVAGLMLVGTEVKSIKKHGLSFNEAFCFFNDKKELFIKNMFISKLSNLAFNHEELRDRKLLLNKKELNKLFKGVSIKGNTVVLTKIFTNDKGLFKAEIALAKGKKLYDKRNSIKEKDIKRELENG
jgi:SsrA-binding protein